MTLRKKDFSSLSVVLATWQLGSTGCFYIVLSHQRQSQYSVTHIKEPAYHKGFLHSLAPGYSPVRQACEGVNTIGEIFFFFLKA